LVHYSIKKFRRWQKRCDFGLALLSGKAMINPGKLPKTGQKLPIAV
jgi:hypothetical protein